MDNSTKAVKQTWTQKERKEEKKENLEQMKRGTPSRKKPDQIEILNLTLKIDHEFCPLAWTEETIQNGLCYLYRDCIVLTQSELNLKGCPSFDCSGKTGQMTKIKEIKHETHHATTARKKEYLRRENFVRPPLRGRGLALRSRLRSLARCAQPHSLPPRPQPCRLWPHFHHVFSTFLWIYKYF